ncbi:MAG: metallophosphoesterase, partial [Lachnoanaerobaculum gingivalis]
MKNIFSKIIGLGAVGSISLLLRSFYERKNFKTVQYSISSEKIESEKKIVFLTDLHNNSFGKNNEKLLAAIEDISPDLVLIGGDMITVKSRLGIENVLPLLKRLSSKYKCIYANGNHEQRLSENKFGLNYRQYKQIMEDMGIVYLSNKSYDLDDNMCVHGLDLERKYYLRRFKKPLDPGYINKHISIDESKFNILLAHSPLFVKDYADSHVDLALAGHFHGGTIRFPCGVGVMTPQLHFFNRLVVGMKKVGNMVQIIGAGLGTHSINIRLNDMSELIVINLK